MKKKNTNKDWQDQAEPEWGLPQKLRELDATDVEWGQEFYEKLHGRIMARIEKTWVRQPESKSEKTKRRATAKTFTVVSPDL